MQIRVEDVSPSLLTVPSPPTSLSHGWRAILLSIVVHAALLWLLSTPYTQPVPTSIVPAIQAQLWFTQSVKENAPIPATEELPAAIATDNALSTPTEPLPEASQPAVTVERHTVKQAETSTPAPVVSPEPAQLPSKATSPMDFNAKRATQGFLNQIERRQQEALAEEAIREFRYQSTHPDIPHWQGERETKGEIDTIAVNCDSGLNEALALIGKFTGGRVNCAERADFDFAVKQRLGRLKPLTNDTPENN